MLRGSDNTGWPVAFIASELMARLRRTLSEDGALRASSQMDRYRKRDRGSRALSNASCHHISPCQSPPNLRPCAAIDIHRQTLDKARCLPRQRWAVLVLAIQPLEAQKPASGAHGIKLSLAQSFGRNQHSSVGHDKLLPAVKLPVAHQ